MTMPWFFLLSTLMISFAQEVCLDLAAGCDGTGLDCTACTGLAQDATCDVSCLAGYTGDPATVEYTCAAAADPADAEPGTTDAEADPVVPACTANACTATEVANSDKAVAGSITGSYGDGATAVTCDAGYSGSGNATCQSGGTFTAVTCTANACAATEVANSNKAGTGAITGTTGAAVTVTCDAGYSGTGNATCQTGGTFTAITCAANACAATEVANSNEAGTGSITGTTGAAVTVTCDAGYSGTGNATCQTGGTFTAITCAANACTATQVANSDKAGTGSITGTTGAAVAVTCDAGFAGSGNATCQTSGTFTTITCAGTPCTATEVANSDYAGTGSITGNFGDAAVAVTCDAGYTGSGDATCQTGGTFTTVTCTANACAATEVANSDKAGTDSITGTTGAAVTVTCDAGYSGTGNATCQTGGTFTTITCAAIACASTQVPNSNKSVADSIAGVTGEVVAVTCNTGYSGGGNATCQANATFTSISCAGKACGALDPTAPVNGDGYTTCSTSSTTCVATCDAGYDGSGTVTLVCDGSAITNGASLPTCPAVACPSDSTGGGSAGCDCNDGFTDSGDNNLAPSGAGYTGTCSAVPCPANSTGGGTPGCACDAGYSDGDDNNLAAAGAAYTGTCGAVSCPANSTGGGSSGCACSTGYTDGDNDTLEPAGAGYSGTCAAKSCGTLSPGTPANGTAFTNCGSSSGNCDATCDNGYTSSGTVTLICDGSAITTGTLPTCDIVQLSMSGLAGAVSNSTWDNLNIATFTTTVETTVASLIDCDLGYQKVGADLNIYFDADCVVSGTHDCSDPSHWDPIAEVPTGSANYPYCEPILLRIDGTAGDATPLPANTQWSIATTDTVRVVDLVDSKIVCDTGYNKLQSTADRSKYFESKANEVNATVPSGVYCDLTNLTIGDPPHGSEWNAGVTAVSVLDAVSSKVACLDGYAASTPLAATTFTTDDELACKFTGDFCPILTLTIFDEAPAHGEWDAATVTVEDVVLDKLTCSPIGYKPAPDPVQAAATFVIVPIPGDYPTHATLPSADAPWCPIKLLVAPDAPAHASWVALQDEMVSVEMVVSETLACSEGYGPIFADKELMFLTTDNILGKLPVGTCDGFRCFCYPSRGVQLALTGITVEEATDYIDIIRAGIAAAHDALPEEVTIEKLEDISGEATGTAQDPDTGPGLRRRLAVGSQVRITYWITVSPTQMEEVEKVLESDAGLKELATVIEENVNTTFPPDSDIVIAAYVKPLPTPSVDGELTSNLEKYVMWVGVGVAVLVFVAFVTCCVCYKRKTRKVTIHIKRSLAQGEISHEMRISLEPENPHAKAVLDCALGLALEELEGLCKVKERYRAQLINAEDAGQGSATLVLRFATLVGLERACEDQLSGRLETQLGEGLRLAAIQNPIIPGVDGRGMELPKIHYYIALDEMMRAKAIIQAVQEKKAQDNRPEVVKEIEKQLWLKKAEGDDAWSSKLTARRTCGRDLMKSCNATKWEVREAMHIVESHAGANPYVVEVVTRDNKIDTFQMLIRYTKAGNARDLLAVIRAERPEKRIVLVNQKDGKGNPPLHYAVYNTQLQIVQILVSYLADPNFRKPPRGNTLLHYCCSMNQQKIAKLLIHAGADIHHKNRNKDFCYDMAPAGKRKHMEAFIYSTCDHFETCMMKNLGAVPSLQERAIYRIAFDKVDTDSSGCLDAGEVGALLKNLLGQKATEDECREFMVWFDKDNDGQITFTEYMCGVLRGAHAIDTGEPNPVRDKIHAMLKDQRVDEEAMIIATQSFQITSSQLRGSKVGDLGMS